MPAWLLRWLLRHPPSVILCIYILCMCYASSIYILCIYYAYIMHILCIYFVYSMCIVRSHFRSRLALCSELCVQYSCVQRAAMSGAGCLGVIRIGPPKLGYVYTYMGSNTYKCGRGSDWKLTGEVLWMMKATDGMWYAFDAPKDGAIPTSVNQAKVRFVSTGADAHIPGWHTWTMTMSNNSETTFIEN